MLITFNLLSVAVFFGEDAAAIFLHVEAKLAGFILPIAKSNSEVAIEELNARESGKFFANSFQFVVFLVGRNEKGRREGVVAVFRGVADRLGEAFLVAVINAAILDIRHDIAAKLVEAVLFVDDELGVDLVGVRSETITAGLVLDKRMDVGIVPEKCRL